MATGMKVPAHGACRTGRSSERVCAGPVAGGLGQLVTAASAWPKGWQRAQTGQASAVLALCGAFSLQEHQEVREEGREKSPGGEGTAPEGNEVLPSLLRGHSRPRHPRTCHSSHPISLCCLLPAFSKTWSPMTESTRSGPRAARPPPPAHGQQASAWPRSPSPFQWGSHSSPPPPGRTAGPGPRGRQARASGLLADAISSCPSTAVFLSGCSLRCCPLPGGRPFPGPLCSLLLVPLGSHLHLSPHSLLSISPLVTDCHLKLAVPYASCPHSPGRPPRASAPSGLPALYGWLCPRPCAAPPSPLRRPLLHALVACTGSLLGLLNSCPSS